MKNQAIPKPKRGSAVLNYPAAALLTLVLMAGGAAISQDTPLSPTPPRGEVWVYPQGVFPDDFYSLWLAVNGTAYASGELPYSYYADPDTYPDSRPVFVGEPPESGIWTVVLKARRFDAAGDGSYAEGPFTAFNLGLAAGTQLTKDKPIPPANYLLAIGENQFSTGFGTVLLKRSVKIQGEKLPDGTEHFFGYTPNFDPSASPDTNPSFEAEWLPATYPSGSEFEPGEGCGVRSTKPVIYGGYSAFVLNQANVGLSLSNCLLYGQYAGAISDYTGPNDWLIVNVDILHTYHCHQVIAKNDVGMLSWAISVQNVGGSGGKRLIEGCFIDQSPTWQEYYFGANPKQNRYTVGAFPGGHAVYIDHQSKASPDDYVRIENSTMKNCGSNVMVYDTSDIDLLVKNCVIDGGFFSGVPITKYGSYIWRGNCIIISGTSVDAWGNSPVIEIVDNELTARGLGAWGVSMWGCANGEVTVADNAIVCDQAGLNYAGGVLLRAYWTDGSNRNQVLDNTILGTGSWAIKIDAPVLVACEENVFRNNDLSQFLTQNAGAVYFGPLANYNVFSGDAGLGIIDLGTGNVVE